MKKKILPNYIWIGQKTGKGCAYAVANQIITYYNNHRKNASELCTKDEQDGVASAIGLLEDLEVRLSSIYKDNRFNGTFTMDKKPILTKDEIIQLIEDNNPIVCLVGEGDPPIINEETNEYVAVSDYQDGHWVVIIGYDDTNPNKFKILVSDPEIDLEKNDCWISYGIIYYTRFGENNSIITSYFRNATAYPVCKLSEYFLD